MYNQPEIALAKYQLEAGAITKGRGAYICETSVGKKLLLPYRGSEERADFLRKILSYVREQGMPVEQLLTTGEGTVLSKDDSETRYILKDYIVGTECNTQNENELIIAFRELARLHKILEGYQGELPSNMKEETGTMWDICQKHYREMVNVKNYIKSKKKKNEFEMLFQNNYGHFEENAKNAIKELGETKEHVIAKIICHGDFTQHNIVKTEKGWRIVNFEHINYNYPVTDLCNFLRKIMEKNNWNQQLGEGLLESYGSLRRLTEAEWRQLGLMLLFPEKFWKIMNHYGNTRKSWGAGRDMEKFEKLLEQEQARCNFLEKIFAL